jgi:hypothetical protein
MVPTKRSICPHPAGCNAADAITCTLNAAIASTH